MTLDERVRAIVREELRAAGVAERIYDRDHLPDGFTDPESFNVACRRLKLDPQFKCGRSWRVPASVWIEARTARAQAPKTDEQLADELLGANPKFRLVK